MFAVLLMGVPASGLTQDRGGIQKPQRPYMVVLDIVYPWPAVDDPVDFLTITMRLSPSRSPESLIEARFDSPEKVSIDYLKGGQTINRILPRGDLPPNLDPAILAQSLGVVRKTRQVDGPTAKRWFDELWSSLASSLVMTKDSLQRTQLDGTLYEVQVRSRTATWSLQLGDAEAGSAVNGRSPIVRWMNTVRVALESQ
jgi:hypothetical protein